MQIFAKPLDKLSADDLAQAIGIASESLVLDFKRDLYGNSDADKREFAKDVSGLANAAGGHLLIGIDEDDGVASAIFPISGLSLDAEILRLQSIARDGIEPRLTGIDFMPVPVAGGHVLVVQVPASWNAPHRVGMKSNHFYMRRSRKTDPMSVQEIREMIVRNLDRLAVANEFRAKRFDEVHTNLPEGAPAFFMLHVIPMAPNRPALDVPKATQLDSVFPPCGGDGYRLRPNFYGAGRALNLPNLIPISIQIHRNGALEAVVYNCERPMASGPDIGISGFMVLNIFRMNFPPYIRGLHTLGFEPPYAVYLSVGNTFGRCLDIGIQYVGTGAKVFQHQLLCEPVLLETADIDSPEKAIELLRPGLDQLWQAFEYERFNIS